MPTPMDDTEARMGIQPVSELLAERDLLVKRIHAAKSGQMAELRAVYGAWGTFEHTRKVELSRIKSLLRLQAMADKRKMTNDQVDAEAHEHPDYTRFVVEATKRRAEYHRLEAEVEMWERQIEGIDFAINRGQSVARHLTGELMLGGRNGA